MFPDSVVESFFVAKVNAGFGLLSAVCVSLLFGAKLLKKRVV